MDEDLRKRAEDLEETLKLQLHLAKHESGDIAKAAGTVLVGGILSYTLFRIFRKKKSNKTDRVLKTLEKEGLLDSDIKSKLTQKHSSGFWAKLSGLLLPLAINYGKDFVAQRIGNEKKVLMHDVKIDRKKTQKS
jgi:hypothetical protein